MNSSERRALASRIPELSVIARQLSGRERSGSAIPVLYVEFCDLATRPTSMKMKEFRAACKQATAAALKASIGTVLRRSDLVAAGRGGQWFIAVLAGRDLPSRRAKFIDADLGLAAERLRQRVQAALRQTCSEPSMLRRVTVRCGWNIVEPSNNGDLAEALRHAIRGAALVARVEERRAIVLSAVTHELRTPLTAIMGFTERLQTDAATRAQRSQWLSVIASEASRLHRLTEGLIDLGAWNAGSLQLHLAPVPLRVVLCMAAKTVAQRAELKGIRTALVGCAQVIADRDRLLQIFINLLDNAVRHTPAGGVIKVRIARGKTSARVTIQDGGSGFAPAVRRKLGAPFNAGADGKTGLGLAIAKVLLDAHLGKLEFGRMKGAGGRLSVILPYR